MIRSSHRDSKVKAIAEVLAMIADAHPELAPNDPRAVRESDEWLWESATEFCAVLDRYAERVARIRKENHSDTHHRSGRALLRQRHGLTFGAPSDVAACGRKLPRQGARRRGTRGPLVGFASQIRGLFVRYSRPSSVPPASQSLWAMFRARP